MDTGDRTERVAMAARDCPQVGALDGSPASWTRLLIQLRSRGADGRSASVRRE